MTLIILGRYYKILLGQASLFSDTNIIPKSYSVADPVAGSQITYYKEIAVNHAWSLGHLPIWLPKEGLGITLAGNQAAPWFVPEIVLHLLFPHNLSIWNVVALTIGACGSYLFARALNISYLGSIVVGLSYSLSGPAIANLNLDMINPLMVMPYLALSSTYLIDAINLNRNKYLWIAINTFVASQLFLSGFVEVLPIELITIGLITLTMILKTKGSWQSKIAMAALWSATLIAGFVAALVAIVPFLTPLTSYYSFQDTKSWSLHNPRYWLLSLFDYWSFGKAITSGSLQINNTVWTAGTPILFGLSATAPIALFIKRPSKDNHRAIALVMTAVVIFGILGFNDTFSVLNIFQLPPLNLIAMVRFLPFLWWLPLCILAGFGIDALKWRLPLISGFLLTASIIALLWLDIFKKGPAIFAIISKTNLSSTIATNLPIIAISIALPLVIVFLPNKFRAPVASIVSIWMILIMVPSTFYTTKVPTSQIRKISQILTNNGYQNSLTFSPFNYLLPSILIKNSIPSIQAFDVYFPKGYAYSLKKYFGNQSPFQPQSPIFPFAPAMINVPIDYQTIPELKALGVEVVIVSNPLNLSREIPLSAVKISNVPQSLNVSQQSFQKAFTTLLNIYDSRPDLQKAFTIDKSGTTLLKWAISVTNSSDTSAPQLAPFDQIYKSTLSYLRTQPNFTIYNYSTSGFRKPQLRLLGKTLVQGQIEFIYDIANGKNRTPLWVPKTINYSNNRNQDPIAISSNSVTIEASNLSKTLQNNAVNLTSIHFTENSSQMSASFKAARSGIVVIRQQISPGETVTVNNHKTKVLLVDNFMAGVKVRAGNNSIKISFTSPLQLIIFWGDLLLNFALLTTIIVLYFGRRLGSVCQDKQNDYLAQLTEG
ncbi:hypothetical protein [Acidithrix ferrooxidans]|uniref:Bacterial membrane protein YfhO n=1 Tax=Acidithrix ferrooxidans TaxID=1280514 RepID=A0A0D8HI44_9ACTN|nr:hypothetical protein [Acidithrix ferrooxidans]KJF16756.1 hypothetical protein AXFE_24210 [Acidithrix ferrooxidans]